MFPLDHGLLSRDEPTRPGPARSDPVTYVSNMTQTQQGGKSHWRGDKEFE